MMSEKQVKERVSKLKDEIRIYKMISINNKYFACCELCGSIEWQDEEGNSNTLDEEGNMLDEGGNMLEKSDIIWYPYETIFYCHECENPVFAIHFNRVTQSQRKKIYKMSNERRIKWIKSFHILDKLEEDGDMFNSLQTEI